MPSRLPMGEFILANTMTRIEGFKGFKVLVTYYGLDFFKITRTNFYVFIGVVRYV